MPRDFDTVQFCIVSISSAISQSVYSLQCFIGFILLVHCYIVMFNLLSACQNKIPFSLIYISSSSLSPFALLHGWQVMRTLLIECHPLRARGMMWSSVLPPRKSGEEHIAHTVALSLMLWMISLDRVPSSLADLFASRALTGAFPASKRDNPAIHPDCSSGVHSSL